MARLLAVLGSGRASGYTAGLLSAACEGAGQIKDVEIERIHLRRYSFGPCTSCFSCIRQPGGCVLDDDMGRDGQGPLFQAVLHANALLVVDAVHLWGPTAYSHLFFERLYPALWTGELNGMPFASISCASNQGMQHVAREQLCKWAGGKGMRYVGGLAVHCVNYDAALEEARDLGRRLAEAALDDAKGRVPFANDEERFLQSLGQPFDLARTYLENLTQGTMEAAHSLPLVGLNNGAFPANSEQAQYAQKAHEELIAALDAYEKANLETCMRRLASASSYWTNATWLAFLRDKVIGTEQPPAYKPLPED